MATIYWRGSRAYLQWSAGGQQIRRSLGAIDRAAAEKIRRQKEAELEHGVTIIARDQLVREFFATYLDWYKAEHPTTDKQARSETKRFVTEFGHRPVDSIRAIEIEQYKARRLTEDKAAPETVGKELRRIKAALRRGVAWGELSTNPAREVQAPRGVRSVAVSFYTTKQMRALYKTNPARAPLWALMVNTGVRRGEIAKMRKQDVVGDVLRVESDPEEGGRTKSGRWREIPLNAAAKAALRKLGDPIVTVHRDTLSDWFALDAAAAKIGGTLHRLRHTFCAHLVMAGVPLRRVQQLAGHADYKVTEVYAHLAPATSKDTVGKLKL